MHNNDKDPTDTISEAGGDQRREPLFSGFEEEDNYEEPDRDTDYASSYHDEGPEDDEFDESSQAEGDLPPQAEIVWEDSEPDDNPEESEPEQTGIHNALSSEEEEPEEDEWQDDDGYYEEDAADFQKWPLSVILVAIIALLLLAAGGYGIMQQRSAAQEEIRQLQATLATAASPANVRASHDAVRDMQQRNTELVATVDALTLENRRLADTVAGLESQLEAQQAALAKQASTPSPATPKPVAAPAPVKPTPAPTASRPVSGGAWFVNFSSYDQRATAEGWASKLKPGAGKVVVTTGDREGATVYRVRVVELANRESAEKIARQLEKEYGLPKLWVGQQ